MNYDLPTWEELPTFSIYRDQLIEIVSAALSPILEEHVEDDQILTPSMVNNYVKWGMIPKPNKKKYEREHIAMCIMLSAYKIVLPLNVVNQLIEGSGDIESRYANFKELTERVFCHRDSESQGSLVENPMGVKAHPSDQARNPDTKELYMATLALYYKLQVQKHLKENDREEAP